MEVAIVFKPDPDLGPDPLDEAQQPRRQGWFIGDTEDCIVIHREWGEQFEGGSRTHVSSQGAWENVSLGTFTDALAAIEHLPEAQAGEGSGGWAMTVGDRVAARLDHEGDDGLIVKGEVGIIVGRRGEDYVVRFGPGRHAIMPARELATPREALHGARK